MPVLESRGYRRPSFMNWEDDCQTHVDSGARLCRGLGMFGDQTKWRTSKKSLPERWGRAKTYLLVDVGAVVEELRQVGQSSSITEEVGLAIQFDELAEQWKRETALLSNLQKKAIHPAYQRIIGLGPRAIPHILGELKRTRGHWLWALNAITGEDPAPSGATFSEAVDAWFEWGKTNGYL